MKIMMNKKISGVILAGGNGKRLGGVLKANIKIDGMNLLQRAKNSLEQANGTKIISIGSSSPKSFDLSPNWVAVKDLGEDEIAQKGPLAGIAAAVDYLWKNDKQADSLQADSLQADYLMSLAVDSVFFPAKFYDLALQHFDKNVDVVIAKHKGQIYPTNALWRVNSISNLPKRFEEISAQGIRGMLKSMNVVEIEINSADGGDPSQNVNEIGDIIACTERIKKKKAL
jgi:molybdopterin-guanine dinucleotide biosynthesis protein A